MATSKCFKAFFVYMHIIFYFDSTPHLLIYQVKWHLSALQL